MPNLWTPQQSSQYNRAISRTGRQSAASKSALSFSTPNDLTNKGAWWDYSNTGGKVHTIAGPKVSSVDDCNTGGSGVAMGNNNPGGEPAQTTLNALNAASFTSGVGIRTIDFTGLAQPYTWWAVLKMGASGNFIMLEDDIGGTASMEINGGKFAISAGGTHVQSSVAVDTTTTHLIIGVYNGAASSVTVDNTTTSGLTVAAFTFGRMWNGWTTSFVLGESGYTTSVMTGTEMANMRTYASAKWGTP